MPERLFALLQTTAEWKGGPIALTFLVITIVLTVYPQFVGTWSQWQTVRDESKPIDALDTPLYLGLAAYMVIFFVYGVHIRSIGSVFNVFWIAPVVWRITAKIYKRRGFTPGEQWLAGLLAGACPVSPFYPVASYILVSLVMLAFPALQIYKIWSKGTAQGVEPRMYASFAFVCLVWGVYGTQMKDPFIAFVGFAFWILYTGIVFAWWKPRLFIRTD